VDIEKGFLADILAHPADEAPRLIYADWLEDHGDEVDIARAELIRVQIELAKLRQSQPHLEGPRHWALQAREGQLLAAYQSEWTAENGAPARAEEYHRGFVDTVTLSPEDFLEHADDLFRRIPLEYVRLVHVKDLEKNLEAFTRSRHLTRLAGLRLDMQLSFEALRSLARCPYFTNLSELTIHCPELTEPGVRLLADTSVATRLRRLSISAQTVARGAIRALADSPNLSALESLTLHWSPPVDLAEIAALGNSPHFSSLQELNLWHNQLRPEGVQALAGPVLERLEVLKLGGNWFGDDGAIALSRLASPNLRKLDLAGNQIRARGMQVLTGSALLANVQYLDLRGNITLSDGLTALASSRFTTRLQTLLLHFNGIGDAGVEALARSKHLSELVWVELIANRVTSSGARALAASPNLKRLARLQMERNDIDTPAQQALSARFGAGVSV
jgi:uncharacterized protein (TIGR02996 family)